MIIEARKEPSTKLRMIEDTVRQALTDNSKCVVFAQWLAEIGLVHDHLAATLFSEPQYRDRNMYSIVAFGGHGEDAKHDIIRTFRDDAKCCVLIANRVIGVGVNISFARIMIFGTFGYNPWSERQMMDRLDRYGQKNCVMVYYPVISGTVEERVFSINRRKMFETTIILDGHAAAKDCAMLDGVVDISAWGNGGGKNVGKHDAFELIDAFGDTAFLEFHGDDEGVSMFDDTEEFTLGSNVDKSTLCVDHIDSSDGGDYDNSDHKLRTLRATSSERGKARAAEHLKRNQKFQKRVLAERAATVSPDMSIIQKIMAALNTTMHDVDSDIDEGCTPTLTDEELICLGKRKAEEMRVQYSAANVVPPKKKKPTKKKIAAPPIPNHRYHTVLLPPIPPKTVWRSRISRPHRTIDDGAVEEDHIEEFNLDDIITDHDDITEFSESDYHDSSSSSSLQLCDDIELADTEWVTVVP